MPDAELARIRAAWEELRPLLLAGPCRACECLHGLLAELRLALEELPGIAEQAVLLDAVRGVKRPAELHACLGCQPCGPGTLLTEFYRAGAKGNS
ncbi:MAG: hypothetical protein ACE147_14815 [Candidatus Methylomirabilales bacterium]